MLAENLLPEFEFEMALTRKVLEKVDWTKKDWKPHDKSMSFGELAAHLGEVTNWCIDTLTKPEVDMAKTPYAKPNFNTLEDLLSAFDRGVEECKKVLLATKDSAFDEIWKLKAGEQVFISMPRIAVYRGFIIKHMVHHRGQMTVYLRLNDIAVPSVYGPSADATA